MNNASRVIYADEEMHHSLSPAPTFLTPRELSVWNLRRGGSGITPSRNVHERARSGVETPPPTTVRSSSEFSAIVRAIGVNFLFGKPINSGSLLRGQKG